MIIRFKNHIFENAFFTKNDRLILALSGGIDSVALFHLLRLSAFNFEVAHVNYGLRGNDSDQDEEFVKSLCTGYGIEFHVKKIAPEYWESDNLNIQNEARKIRYMFFNQLVKSDSDKILTAHQQDDNLETVLMNFTRGSGIKGMMGIPEKKGNVIRPMLNLNREELESFLTEKDFKWRNDKSNSSVKYKRNRFRLDIIPLLKKENPALLKAFQQFIGQITPVYKFYTDGVESFKLRHLKQLKTAIQLSWESVEELNLFLFPVISEFGFNSTQSSDIKNALNRPGRAFYSETHTLTIDRDFIFIRKKTEEIPTSIEIQKTTTFIIKPVALRCSVSDETSLQKNASIGQFDLEKLHFPLTLRNWRQGDKIKPLGMSGKKKISDILIDNKVPMHEKDNVYVLESNSDIIWLMGMVISDDYKIDNKTKKVWKIQLQ